MRRAIHLPRTQLFSHRGLFFLALVALLALVAWPTQATQAAPVPPGGQVFASSNDIPLLQFPEGITSWEHNVFVSSYNVVSPEDSRIFVFNADDGHLVRTLGGVPGQELISEGALLGLTIDKHTGDLYAAANFIGAIVKIHAPLSANPQVSLYAQLPAGAGPDDLNFNQQGALFASDSNLGVVYEVPPGGGNGFTIIGPPSSGAPVDDQGLLQAAVAGLSPNGLVFGADWHTLYVANTFSDQIIAFHVNSNGQPTGSPSVFASYPNPDLEEYPTGFEGLILPNTHIGPSASTPVNGPDGMVVDSLGRIWVTSTFGDNLAVLDQHNGHVVETFGTSQVTANGLLNLPSGMTFVGTKVFNTNLGIFTDLPFLVTEFDAGVTGWNGNGNQ